MQPQAAACIGGLIFNYLRNWTSCIPYKVLGEHQTRWVRIAIVIEGGQEGGMEGGKNVFFSNQLLQNPSMQTNNEENILVLSFISLLLEPYKPLY